MEIEYISYKITKIDEELGHLYVTFTFKSKEVFEVNEVLDYQSKCAIVKQELKNIDEQYRDNFNRTRTRNVKKIVKTIQSENLYDVRDPIKLDKELKNWAMAYMNGVRLKESSKVKVSESVKKLIGKENITKL